MSPLRFSKTDPSQRRRTLSPCLAVLWCCLGAAGTGQETRLAYYEEDPEVATSQVQTVAEHWVGMSTPSRPGTVSAQPFVTIAAPLQDEDRSDASIPSSSDLPAPFVPNDDILLLDPPEEVTLSDQFEQPYPVEGNAGMNGSPSGLPTVPPPTRRSSRAALGAMAGAPSAVPTMVGDFFSGPLLLELDEDPSILFSLAGGDRRFKVAENVSPIPQDRVFFNYNHFHNALRDVKGATRSLNRFTFGFEKTILDRMASVELRLPFSGGLNSIQDLGNPDTRGTELGNLGLSLKANLLSGDDWIVAGGTTMTFPTGDDDEIRLGSGDGLRIQNDAVHLAPYLGWAIRWSNRNFAQGFVQADFDLSGNDVRSVYGGYEGVFQDQNLLFVDIGLGHWFHRRCTRQHGILGAAAIAELHYTTTLNDSDWVGGLRNPFNRMDVLNATGALHLQAGLTSLRIGGAAPLRDDEERLFDAEIIVQLNRNF